MRKISFVLVAAALLSSAGVLASTSNSTDPSQNLSAQISEMLDTKSFEVKNGEVSAQVRFTINNEQEIVVLSVETSSVELERFVKSKLNYKGVRLTQFEEGKVYTIPIKVVV